MAAAGLRFAARQRDVDIAGLEHLKTFADGLDAAERLEQRFQAIRGHAEDFDVDVLRVAFHQAVAYPAADEERASAGVADGKSDRVRAGETLSHDRSPHEPGGRTSGRSRRRTPARWR